MGQTLTQIAEKLEGNQKKIQLIYAFNGVGKTRLSREFKQIIETDDSSYAKILYYNAFTEDLFFWDNDLISDNLRKLKIQKNNFTHWLLEQQGQEGNITETFQKYTSRTLTPMFNEDYTELSFSITKGGDDNINNIKISKGEESCFIWCFFYCLLYSVIDTLNSTKEQRDTEEFNDLRYLFIDDPVSSLDDNHLIELAVDIAELINNSKSELKFIITTHNPLFFNVLNNALKNGRGNQSYTLNKNTDGTYVLKKQENGSPFSYHIFLAKKLEEAISNNRIYKYHFNFLRNILEKTATFLGYNNWGKLLEDITTNEDQQLYARIINISSHSQHSADEFSELEEKDKEILTSTFNALKTHCSFKY